MSICVKLYDTDVWCFYDVAVIIYLANVFLGDEMRRGVPYNTFA